MEFEILYRLQEIHSGALNEIMVFITSLGNKGWFWIMLALLFLILERDRKCGLTMLLALAFSFLAGNLLLKNIVMRPRPCWIDPSVTLLIPRPSDYSFPSGHTFASFAAASSLVRYHRKTGIAALCLAALIAFSRLYLFAHFPTDVLAGVVFGVCASAAAYGLIKRYYRQE